MPDDLKNELLPLEVRSIVDADVVGDRHQVIDGAGAQACDVDGHDLWTSGNCVGSLTWEPRSEASILTVSPPPVLHLWEFRSQVTFVGSIFPNLNINLDIHNISKLLVYFNLLCQKMASMSILWKTRWEI